jgi:hypothetical protein
MIITFLTFIPLTILDKTRLTICRTITFWTIHKIIIKNKDNKKNYIKINNTVLLYLFVQIFRKPRAKLAKKT